MSPSVLGPHHTYSDLHLWACAILAAIALWERRLHARTRPLSQRQNVSIGEARPYVRRERNNERG